MLKVLQTYIKKDFNTIDKIIHRYAPESENDTQAYINFVEEHSGIPRDRILTNVDRASLVPLVFAMATMENGTPPNMADISQGWDLLGALKPIPSSPPQDPGDKKKTNNLPIIGLGLALVLIVLTLYNAKRKKIHY
jgi:hypothetical protein